MADDAADRQSDPTEGERLEEETGVGIGDEGIKRGTEEPRGEPMAPDPPDHRSGLETASETEKSGGDTP